MKGLQTIMYYTRYYTEQYSGKTKKFLRNINNR